MLVHGLAKLVIRGLCCLRCLTSSPTGPLIHHQMALCARACLLNHAGASTYNHAFHVSKHVLHPVQLDALKLGWCKIASGEGARAVSELLLFNSTLTSLDLRGNSLGNDGAILIGRGLR